MNDKISCMKTIHPYIIDDCAADMHALGNKDVSVFWDDRNCMEEKKLKIMLYSNFYHMKT